MDAENIKSRFNRESPRCTSCRENPGYVGCPACHGFPSRCKECGGSGKIKCPYCKGGQTGEFAGTTLH